MRTRLEVEREAIIYAEARWEEILGMVKSPLARGFLKPMRESVIDILRRAFLAGADEVSR